jgi:hypothetical protein
MTRVGSQRHKIMRNLNIQDERTNCTYVTILLLHSVEWQTKIYTQQLTGMGAQPIFQLGNSPKNIGSVSLSVNVFSVRKIFTRAMKRANGDCR